MSLVLLCQFTAQHVSDVNTSIFERELCLLPRMRYVQIARIEYSRATGHQTLAGTRSLRDADDA